MESLSDANDAADDDDANLIEIDDALSKLKQHHESAARAIELHFFGGMTVPETATTLGVSISTVGRDIRFAKAWLLARLQATQK